MKKLIFGLLIVGLLAGSSLAMTPQGWDDVQHYTGGYMGAMTLRAFGVSDRRTAQIMTVLCVAKEVYDESKKTPDGKNGKGWQTEELVWGLLGSYTGMIVYDYSLTFNPRGLTVSKSW